MRFLLFLLLAAGLMSAQPAPEPPVVAREFRGMWIATVGNIDWPSKPGLPVAQQQAELRALLDGARKLNLNVVVFQVRPGADALYESPLEPWSEYLTGRMGQAPNPRWDPLKFACDEAHVRGLELHAWINPFRARYHQAVSPIAPGHVSRTHPSWIIPYGRYLWLDPGNRDVQAHVQRVLADIVRRYDVDGLHLDDYFFPYPERNNVTGVFMEFPDDGSYAAYRGTGGRLNQGDWRRDSVNRFIETLYGAVHREKPWVKVGLSPFGIWRPDNPPGIKGLDQYAVLYADARLWVQRGWADYFAPQLYWPLNRREQSFPALLRWWNSQNERNRLMVPGLASASIGKDRPATDIANQVRSARQLQADGVLFWNASSLKNNLGGVANGLTIELFKEPALVPPTPWLGTNAPPAPELIGQLKTANAVLELGWKLDPTGEPARQWVLQTRLARMWRTELLPGGVTNRVYDVRRGQAVPDEVRLLAVGRSGIQGEPATWEKPRPAGRP